jgi:hypothetical protein
MAAEAARSERQAEEGKPVKKRGSAIAPRVGRVGRAAMIADQNTSGDLTSITERAHLARGILPGASCS